MHCEIDEMVMEVSQKYLPDLFCGRDDPRLTTHVGCGMEFMKNHEVISLYFIAQIVYYKLP